MNQRQKEIVSTLTRLKEPVFIKYLSEAFSVSERTIKYDIQHIKKWLSKKDIQLQSQPNKGIWIEVNNESQQLKLHHKLLMEKAVEDIWGVEGRIKKIFLILSLQPAPYSTAQFLAKQLFVTRKTIYSDLSQVRLFLEKNGFALTTVPRKGYAISGDEIGIRQLIEQVLTSKFELKDSYYDNVIQLVENELYELTPEIRAVSSQLSENFERMQGMPFVYVPSTKERLTLFLRLGISLFRIGKEAQSPAGDSLVQTKDLSDYALYVYEMAQAVFSRNHHVLTQIEFDYIYRNSFFVHGQEELLKLTNKIIEYISDELLIPFEQDSTLQNNLLAHLSNRFTEENAILLEKNPFMADLKRNYKQLYDCVTEACRRYMEKNPEFSIEMISSFITLHFLVSLETTFAHVKHLKVLYVCASGGGVARVVKNRLEKSIPQLRVVEYCGLEDLELVLQKREFDLVVSVFPIELDIPTIWVEPVPSEQNIIDVKEKVKEISKELPLLANDTDESLDDEAVALDAEELSREIIIEGMEVFQKFKKAFQTRIKTSLEDALLIHILLMVHRLKFRREYDYLVNSSHPLTGDYQKVEEILQEQGLEASDAEKRAVLFYIEKEDEK